MRLHWLLIPALIAISACGPSGNDARAGPEPSGLIESFSKSDVVRLRGEAESACKCARAARDSNGRKACWTDFDRQTKNRRANEDFALACGPISPHGICLGGSDDSCVTIDYSSNPDFSFCTLDEARLVEATLAKAWKAGDNDQNAILGRLQERFRRGDIARKVQPIEHGCSG